MGLTETELNIIKVFTELKQASLGLIADKMMITPGYAGYLCKYLVKGGYLTLTDHNIYCLTAKGREVLTGRTAGIPWDQKTIQAIARELAKQLGGAVTTLPQKVKGRSKAVLPREPKRKEIKIKESFIDPL
ncbi:winged helix-turn-helix domain-containing protein, partial [Patescibacteria group bacterium]|nr:winged helix-turn-helix domain-containing protein [Patescibacteria group bacterium]